MRDSDISLIDLNLPHAFVDDIDNPHLSDDDIYHFGKVLRLRSRDGITVSDAKGSWRECVFGPPLEPTGEIFFELKPKIEITIGFALIKKGKPEMVVQKLTELGVNKILPVVAQRSVVQWSENKIIDSEKRFSRIAREAAMQSRQVYIPEVLRTTPLAALKENEGIALAHPGGKKLSLTHSFLIIGPEGGWTPEEVDGRECFSLGSSVLRSETAAISAGVLLTSLRDRRISEIGE